MGSVLGHVSLVGGSGMRWMGFDQMGHETRDCGKLLTTIEAPE